MSTTAMIPTSEGQQNGAAVLEQVIVKGDLGALKPEERVAYYKAVCESVGLNPLTRPFEYLTLNGRLILYANRGCTDQLRAIKGISVEKLERELQGDIYTVTAYGRDRTGRTDSSIGAVNVSGLKGEALANAYMKAETKSKRRLALSLAGLGMFDEVEVESIPGAVRETVDPDTGLVAPVEPKSLLEKVEAREAEVTTPEPPSGSEAHESAVSIPSGAADSSLPGLDLATFLTRVEAAKLSNGTVSGEMKTLFGDDARVARLTDEQRARLAQSLSI